MAISVVQTKTGTVGSALTIPVTLTSTTAGNCLVVCYASSYDASKITGLTLGPSGSGGNFAKATGITSAGYTDAEIWVDHNCAGGQTTLTFTTDGGSGAQSIAGWVVYEISGLTGGGAVDQVSAQGGTTTAVTSGTTATTTAASEIWVGMGTAYYPGITGPSPPWTNTETGMGSGSSAIVGGYQVVSSTGTATYASTATGAQQAPAVAGAVATLMAYVAPGPPVARRNPLPMQAVNRAAYY